MLRSARFSIAGLMFAVAVAAVAVAGLRSATAAWAGAMLMLVWGVLGLAIFGAICRTDKERAWCLGFALFGSGYLALAAGSANLASLPTTTLLVFLGSKIAPMIQQTVWSRAGSLHEPFLQIAHCLWAVVAALIGGASHSCFMADRLTIARTRSLKRNRTPPCPGIGGAGRP